MRAVLIQDALAELGPVRAAVSEGRRVALHGDAGSWRSAIVATLAAEHPGSVLVRVPRGPERAEHVLLALAQQAGDTTYREVAHALRRRPSDVQEPLELVRSALGDRPLFVEELDGLRDWSPAPDLAEVLQPSLDALGAWLRETAVLVTTSRKTTTRTNLTVEPPPGPPWQLANGAVVDLNATWARVERRPDRLRLVLTASLLTGRAPEDLEVQLEDEESLRTEAWSHASPALQRLMTLLAIHGRPLRSELARKLVGAEDRSAVDSGLQALVLDADAESVWLTSPWMRWCTATTSSVLQEQAHKDLAATIAEGLDTDETMLAHALDVVEAERHYAAAYDLDSAARFAVFGVGPLLSTARELSIARKYTESARTYAHVLALDEALHARGPVGIGARARAYALHYQHYNRYKGSLEPLAATRAGYRASLDLWEENALFWSRHIVASFVGKSLDEGEAALEVALNKVPEHPNKDAILFERTMNRLLRRGALAGALRLWSVAEGSDAGTRAKLAVLLAQGCATRELVVGAANLRFESATHVRLESIENGWRCEIEGLADEQAENLDAVMSKVIGGLRARATRLIGRPGDELSPDERAKRRNVLERIDVVGSRLLEAASTEREAPRVLLDCVRYLVEANANRARDLLADAADRWVQAGSLTEIDSLLREADPKSISGAACLTLLSVTKPVADQLGARLAFTERVRDTLTSTVGEARARAVLKNLV